MSASRRSRRLEILAVLAGLGASAALLRVFGWSDLGDALSRFSPRHALIYLLFGLAVRLSFSLRWFLVARALGPSPEYPRFFAARLAGDAVGVLIPTGSVGGDPLRVALLYGRGVGGSRASAGVALDRALEMISNMVVSVVYIAIFSLSRAADAGASPVSATTAYVVLGLLFAWLALPLVLLRFGLRPVSPFLPRVWMRKRPRWEKALVLIESVEDELMRLLQDRFSLVIWGSLGSILIEGLIIFEYRYMLLAFGIDVPLTTILMMLLTVGLVRVVPVPAGLGTLELSQVTLMAAIAGRPDLGFVMGVVLRLHETLWTATGLAALSSQGFSLARAREVGETAGAASEEVA